MLVSSNESEIKLINLVNVRIKYIFYINKKKKKGWYYLKFKWKKYSRNEIFSNKRQNLPNIYHFYANILQTTNKQLLYFNKPNQLWKHKAHRHNPPLEYLLRGLRKINKHIRHRTRPTYKKRRLNPRRIQQFANPNRRFL